MISIKEWFDSCGPEEQPTSIIFTYLSAFRAGDRFGTELPIKKLMTIEEAMPWLTIKFNCGYGTQECPNFYAWSKNYVYFVHEYDGATWLSSAPRFPRVSLIKGD